MKRRSGGRCLPRAGRPRPGASTPRNGCLSRVRQAASTAYTVPIMRMRYAVARRAGQARLTAALALAGGILWTAAPLQASAQSEERTFYACVADTRVEVESVGIALCDATPTPALRERAEPDNLQIRDGALVVEVRDGGIAARAGTQAADMIYRVAGADVAEAAAAGARLVDIRSDSDTQINFLRRGRPYRIKLRR